MADLLAGQWVLVTAVKPAEREQLAATVEHCGGVPLSSFSSRDPPHLVITRSVRSPKYRALLRLHPHTPVVTPEWLAASTQASWGKLAPRSLVSQAHTRIRRRHAIANPRGLARRAPAATLPAAAAAAPIPPPPQAGRLLPLDCYRVGPFHGLTVCLSGLSAASKAELAAAVAAGGGQHSPALDKKCTHLVTNSTGTAKYL